AHRLAERGREKRAALHPAQPLSRAAAGFSEDTGRMGIVDDEGRVVLFAEVRELAKRTDLALHGEDAVRDEKAAPQGRRLLQGLLEGGEVAVRRDEPLGFAEACAVDDRRVVEGVRQEAVLLGEERREEPLVRVPAGHVEDRVLGSEEARDRGLELLVERLRAADEAHRAEAVAPLFERLLRGLHDARVVREAEVVVRGEHEDVPPVHAHARSGGTFEDTLFLPGLRILQRRDLRAAEVGEAGAHTDEVIRKESAYFFRISLATKTSEKRLPPVPPAI